jgi:hypothetical protein
MKLNLFGLYVKVGKYSFPMARLYPGEFSLLLTNIDKFIIFPLGSVVRQKRFERA